VLLFCDSFSLCLVLSIFNSPTQFLPESRVEWCAALLSFLCVWSKVFSTVPTSYLWKQGLSDVLLFVIPFFVFGLKYFSTVLPNSYLWKQGLSDVLLFCDSFLCVWIKSIFGPTNFYLWKQVEWCAALLWFLSLCLVLEYFSTVLPNSYLWKQGLSDVLFCDSFLCLVLKYFSTVLPNSTYESRDWVMCCSFWFLSLCLVLEYFNSPTQFHLCRSWVMCCSLWFLSCVWS
jgi:hypothetical protein